MGPGGGLQQARPGSFQPARWTAEDERNISARHFQHDGLVEDVSQALQASDLDAACLVLEITESLLVHDAESVIARMLELKTLGVASPSTTSGPATPPSAT